MVKLENPEALYLFILVPIFFVIQYLYIKEKKKNLSIFVDNELKDYIIPELSIGKHWFKFIIISLSFVFLIIAIANPQIGTTVERSERKGVDLIVCLDVSNSMLAEDIKPNRLTRAKMALNSLIDQLKNDRIGLVIFAGSAYVQLPITNDYGVAKTFIDLVGPDMMTQQGTAIADALEKANNGFGDEYKKSDNIKSIILISDGEDNDEGAIQKAKELSKEGIVINTIGLGMPEGALIPIKENDVIVDYKKTDKGSYVITKLNESLLKEIARSGEGIYLRANNTSVGLDNIFARINKMEKNEYETIIYKDYQSKYYIFALISFVLLLIEFFIFERSNKYINRKFFFGK